jgi:dTMP kinase
VKTGRFITFEGIDGAGKSTHLDALAQRLRGRGAVVVCTREPGGTPLAERVREIFLHETADVLTETLLAFAARRDHLRSVIVPALGAGRTVLCDRFTDATFAYQGGGGGAAPAVLAQLETWVQDGLQPDLTFWFDLPADVAAQRRAQAREADRFEQRDLEFFERVRAGYAARAAADPARFAHVDAARPRDAVWAQIESMLEARGW